MERPASSADLPGSIPFPDISKEQTFFDIVSALATYGYHARETQHAQYITDTSRVLLSHHIHSKTFGLGREITC